MKIEIGESLFYSWLRHVKECQIVQTNWKISPKWEIKFSDELENIMLKTDEFFSNKYGYKIYKQNTSLNQLLQQAECDALGVCMSDGVSEIYAVDVAFHESGLNYGGLDETVARVVKKCVRTAMCIYGYFGVKKANIIFASPKVGPTVNSDICNTLKFNQSKADNKEINKSELNDFEKLKRFLNDNIEFKNKVRFIYISNEEFKKGFLYNTIEASESDSDTNELFMRSYKLFQLFNKVPNSKAKKTESDTEVPPTASLVLEFNPSDENSIQAITDKS